MKLFLRLFVCFLVSIFWSRSTGNEGTKTLDRKQSGDDYYIKAEEMMRAKHESYKDIAEAYWHAVLLGGKRFKTEDAFAKFLGVYNKRNILEQGYVFVAKEYLARGDQANGIDYLEKAIKTNKNEIAAYHLLSMALSPADAGKLPLLITALEIEPSNPDTFYQLGCAFYEIKRWRASLYYFEKAERIKPELLSARAQAIYLRAYLSVWGIDGVQYLADQKAIAEMILLENQMAVESTRGTVQNTAINVHSLVSCKVDNALKLLVAKAHAKTELESAIIRGGVVKKYDEDYLQQCREEALERVQPTKLAFGGVDKGEICAEKGTDLSSIDGALKTTQTASEQIGGGNGFTNKTIVNLLDENGVTAQYMRKSDYRIKIGYVSVSVKTTPIMILAHQLLKYHDRSKFEVHLFACNKPESIIYLIEVMEGINIGRLAAENVEFFHDVHQQSFKEISDLVLSHRIDILVSWESRMHSNKKSGLFALRPAPIQVAHLVHDTYGSEFIDYLVTDPVASPLVYQRYVSEKYVFLPQSFLVASHAHIEKLQVVTSGKSSLPTSVNKTDDAITPQSNGCGGEAAAFIYCNFNKHSKFDPELFSEWLRTLQDVDDSVLCLLAHPKDSMKNIKKFVHDFDHSLDNRVRFLDYDYRPLSAIKRNGAMCNALLDTKYQNSAITAVDGLWLGVPILTFGNGVQMAARIVASILTTLDITELIAKDKDEYNLLARKLARNDTYYNSVRSKVLSANEQQNPRHPFWDTARYTKNLEIAYDEIWLNYLAGAAPRNLDVSGAEKMRSTLDQRFSADATQLRPSTVEDLPYRVGGAYSSMPFEDKSDGET